MKRVKSSIKEFFFKHLPNSAIIVFHHINEKGVLCSNCVLNYEEFCSFVDEFDRYASLEEVISSPQKRQIAITFDDGLEDLYTHAYPLLKDKGIPFTVFIVPEFVDKEGYITKEQLQILASDPLVTIGSHGLTHKTFTSMCEYEMKLEAEKSKCILEKLTENKISMIAYSHGLVNQNVIQTVANVYEYGLSVSAEPLNWLTKKRKYQLPRFNVENDTVTDTCECIKKLVRL